MNEEDMEEMEDATLESVATDGAFGTAEHFNEQMPRIRDYHTTPFTFVFSVHFENERTADEFVQWLDSVVADRVIARRAWGTPAKVFVTGWHGPVA